MPVTGEFTGITTLANGMKIAVLPFAKQTRLNVRLFVRAGHLDGYIPSKLIPKEQRRLVLETKWGKGTMGFSFHPGVDHALEHMVFKGSKKGKYKNIYKVMRFFRPLDREDETGIGAETMELWVAYYLELSPKDINRALEFLAALTLRPKFLDNDPATRRRVEREFEKEKAVMLEEWGLAQDDLLVRAQEEVRLQMFPNHPLGIALGGGREDIINTTISQVVTKHKTHYHPSNMFLVTIGGGVAVPTVRKLVEKHFRAPNRRIHAISAPAPDIKDNRPIEERVTFETTSPKKTYISMGFPIRRASTQKEENKRTQVLRRYAIWLLEKSFAGRWASRPFFELREKRGIGYRYIPLNEEYPHAGALLLTTHLFPENVLPALRTILNIFRGLATKPIDLQELRDSKESWTQKLASDSEVPSEIARFLFQEFRLRGRAVMFRQIVNAMKLITPEDVLTIAQEIIVPERLHIRMLGNLPTVKSQRAITRLVKNWKI